MKSCQLGKIYALSLELLSVLGFTQDMRATLQINKRTCLLLIFVLVSILSFFYLYVSDEPNTIPLVHDLRQARQCQMITKIEDKSTKKTIDNKLAPLDDFDSYPCVSGAPVFPDNDWNTRTRCVRRYCDMDYRKKDTKRCVQLNTIGGKTPICTYPADVDIYISKNLQKYGQWESHHVDRITMFLKENPDVAFLDVGCNIGAYALSAAHIRTRVIAIDPLLDNLKLMALSVSLGNLQDTVTMIWNAVSDEHSVVRLNFEKGNIGGTKVETAKKSISTEGKSNNYAVGTIKMDDLVFLLKGERVGIKLDIEGGEYKAILGGHVFFEQVNVVFVMVEFLFHKDNDNGVNIVKMLESKGLQPYESLERKKSLKLSDIAQWPDNVFFMRT